MSFFLQSRGYRILIKAEAVKAQSVEVRFVIPVRIRNNAYFCGELDFVRLIRAGFRYLENLRIFYLDVPQPFVLAGFKEKTRQ